MVKRELIFIVLIGLFILSISFAFAANSSSASTATSDSSKVEKAYTCLEDKIKNKCSDLSTEEKIFSLLALDECKDELISEMDDEGCWPKSEPGCKPKLTSQAILALDKTGYDTEKTETWLLDQTIIPTDLIWYLEIDSSEPTTCKITYDNNDYTIKIYDNRKIDTRAGECLSLSENDYWFKVSDDCYNKEFAISCNKAFLTTLLYKKKSSNSSTIYVSENVNSAVAEGKTTEKINSLCFRKGQTNSCDYEATLWSALILDYRGYDEAKSYVPYLVTMADENEQYLPDSFLYLLIESTDYQVNLMSKQVSGYWEVSDDKFYDTALALLALKGEGNSNEKTSAMDWFLQTQSDDGCWNGHIRDTAFILYSAWPKETEETYEKSCEKSGYNCISSSNCKNVGGNKLSDYLCFGTYICCDKPAESSKTCDEQSGIICSSNKDCSGTDILASDLETGETCCFGGECQTQVVESECETNDGICRSSCSGDQDSKNYDCENSGEVCCVDKSTSGTGGNETSYWWLWVLLILIALAIVGIIFKDKLRILLFRAKSTGSSTPSRPIGPGPRFPPSSPLQQRTIPRRIFPPQQQVARRPMPRRDDEFSDVLKKLKDIGGK